MDQFSSINYHHYLTALQAQGIQDASRPIRAQLATISPTNMMETLAQLDRLKGWLDSFRPFPPAVVAELKKLYDVRFTYHSNAIEWNTLSQSETELVLAENITIGGKTLVEHLEVIGHKEAIDYIEELSTGGTLIGEWEIKSLHSLILRTIDQVVGQSEAGRYRTLDVPAAGTDHLYPPHYQVPELMERFVSWLHSEAAARLHPVERASEVHYRLVTIHPFRYGNGRTARLLMNLFLLKDGYPIAVIRNEHRGDYIQAPVHAQSSGDDQGPLKALIASACCESCIEYLRILSTAGDSEGKGGPFYVEMLAFLNPNQRSRQP